MQKPSSPSARPPANPRDALLQKLDAETDLPAMGSAVAGVVQIASSTDQAVRDLTYFVLADVALTQKILRLANTVHYRAAARGQVTTVSRAIFLLGFERVKAAALTMLLVECLADLEHGQAVGAELKRAMCASVIGRELARSGRRPGGEEAAIAALFTNVAQVMVAAYDYEHYAAIQEGMRSRQLSEEQAALEVLGCGYGALSQAILRHWSIPESIVHAVAPLPSGAQKPAKTAQDWMQQVASFSIEATSLAFLQAEPGLRRSAEDALMARFGTALQLDRDRLRAIMRTAAEELAELSSAMNLDSFAENLPAPEHAPGNAAAMEIPAQLLMQSSQAPAEAQDRPRHASGKPLHARELLLEGVQHLMQMSAANPPRINDIMLLALETLYDSMGFRFAALCLKDQAGSEFRARLALGENLRQRKDKFRFVAGGDRDLFSLAMENDADLLIAETGDPKISELLPVWHRALLPDARSIMVLPIVIQDQALGFFYGDRTLPAPEGVPADEASLIKLLKTQLLTALNSRQN